MLYRRTCDATGKNIISVYSEDKKFKVFDQKEWWSDNWDPLSYGRDFDSSRSLFSQFEELFLEVPKDALIKEYILQENCDYTNSSGPCKNCYLVFEMAFCEDVMYSESIFNSKSSSECSFCNNMENCYFCVNSANCMKVFYGLECK